jgi:hypothetical protein
MDSQVVARLQQQIQGDLEGYLGRQQAAVMRNLGASATNATAAYKSVWALQALSDPWRGFTALELQAQQLAWLIRPRSHLDLASVISLLAMRLARERPPSKQVPKAGTAEEQIAYVVSVLEEAGRLREQALRNLTTEDRRFLFEHAAALVENFTPQISELSEHTTAQMKADRRFWDLINRQLDYSAIVASAQVLAQLADEDWLKLLRPAFQGRAPLPSPPAGVTGEVMAIRETAFGLVVIGGPGPNIYELDQRFALVIDLGGDDVYQGLIAAPADVQHGVSAVIDLSGNDIYRASPLGLATGRLGVGLLVDREGDDLYELAQGAGGSGFAGVGILYDIAGNDRYVGAKFTLGAASGGLGLLLDRAGNDTFTSFGYSIGFAGPLGVGAVLDASGDDSYQCGGKYPSNYNILDLPNGKPDDPRFQFEGFCMGTGSGQRIFTGDSTLATHDVAGGLGLLVDLDGNDQYRSANFSQGCGYFFGIGVKLDVAGNDQHLAARYGHAAGAHFGVGLFIDYGGDDVYGSTGPFYNGGTAWDRSVMLFIDAGNGNDSYDLRRSDGLGRADYTSWSLFIEENGNDRYWVPNGMGIASNGSLSGFFDLGGMDEYIVVPRATGKLGRDNHTILYDGGGSLFIDR